MPFLEEKREVEHHETLKDEGFHDAAARGHAATDRYYPSTSALIRCRMLTSLLDTATPS